VSCQVNRGAAHRGRRPARLIATAALAATPLLLAAPASAHVLAVPSTTEAGASAVVQLSVGHGCEGSPTTAVEIRIPDSIYAVTPTRNPFWDVSVKTEPVDPPVTDAHGTTINQRVASVRYRALTPLPDGQRDTFDLSVHLPDAAGSTLVFPTVQTCEKGESAWIQVPAEGQDAEELELPAPAFTITAAGATPAVAGGAASGTAAETATLVAHDKASSGGSALSKVALGVGALGLLVGLIALVRQRRAA
jgi:periplasmic copper chaperone A